MENEYTRFARSTGEGIEPGEFEALQRIISTLNELPGEARRRILESAATFLRIEPYSRRPSVLSDQEEGAFSTRPTASHSPFSEDLAMSPKEFLLEKQPKTDVERVACLAYYLTHYRATPHFRTLDLSQLNTEGAQPKFSNAAYTTNNAVKLGYLVPSSKGQRQLSAVGERFVRALPDREAARLSIGSLRRRTRTRKSRTNSKNKKD